MYVAESRETMMTRPHGPGQVTPRRGRAASTHHPLCGCMRMPSGPGPVGVGAGLRSDAQMDATGPGSEGFSGDRE